MSADLRSMTAYARAQGGDERYAWSWEIRSVNGRGLDMRTRLPQGWDRLDNPLRQRVQGKLQRGNLQIGLTLRQTGEVAPIKVNRALLAELAEVARELHEEGAAVSASADGLLSLRGVLEPVEESAEEDEAQRNRRDSALLADLDEALDQLMAMRRAEGTQLGSLLEGHLRDIEDGVAQASAHAATQPDALRTRLRNLVEELLQASPALPEERLAQEAALLVGKADVREELDRLHAHIQAARKLLSEGGAIGRRLDFLCQEFNREANTLCSKSADVELTAIGLQLKAVIEQLREQVQNLE
ncbi:YicC/YloC family endoribonuclease [Aquibaculum arenosum]|uniref:YicC family protein n=1 Tax=Aquibaculum arenosum TaxID=3032591 RepID=A0ABT5YNE7_9PROT|nr:YicC/YloC family endoribonuclease [Fodinicurvata sp. CAU 1616]MDF2096265.1 YicC family protein [Fodinicurvata sp. CAU 1616]